jgi:hypothetical protein
MLEAPECIKKIYRNLKLCHALGVGKLYYAHHNNHIYGEIHAGNPIGGSICSYVNCNKYSLSYTDSE